MALVHPTRVPRYVAPALQAALEVGLVLVAFLVYRAGRSLVAGETATAVRHAQNVWDLERWLHLPDEAVVQGLVPAVVQHGANFYYVGVHFPLTLVFLVWGYVRRPRAEYLFARNLLMSITAAALVIHIVFPLAPPRMFPQWGFVDTMARYGPNAYGGASGAAANQFAAMPSLHIGWALVIAYVVCRTGPRFLKVAAVAHAVITVFVVVVTANHYWLDGIVAAALLVGAALVLPKPETGEELARSRAEARAGTVV